MYKIKKDDMVLSLGLIIIFTLTIIGIKILAMLEYHYRL